MGNISDLTATNGYQADTRLQRWMAARRDRLTEQRLLDSTLLRLQGEWDPTPQQYVAAKAEAARHLRARKPLALIGLVLAGIALTTGATLAIVTALQPGPHPSAFGPAKALTPKIPAPQRGGSRSSTTGHRHQAGRPPVVLPVLSQPVSGTHTTVARTTSPRSSSKPGAVTGTGTPGPTASPSPSPSRSTQQCAIRLLGLCL